MNYINGKRHSDGSIETDNPQSFVYKVNVVIHLIGFDYIVVGGGGDVVVVVVMYKLLGR